MAAKYSKAPISEVVCGIIFNKNLLLNDAVLFRLLVHLLKEFPMINTHPTIPDDEVVNGAIQTATEYSKAGFTTYRLYTEDGKWQVLVQQNMVTVHWLRQDEENVGNYPGYNYIFAKFYDIYNFTKDLVNDDLKFDENIKSYYLSYGDRINLEPYKLEGNSVADLITLPPPSFELNKKQYTANNYFNRYSIPCDEIDGYAIISVNSPTIPGFGQILMVENKLKGTSKKFSTVYEWFDTAHEIQISFFESIFKSEILEIWK
jgi:uncharacterized protein (TIGR04255 family)